MKTILVPTDFSKNANNAIAYAAALASQVRGKLILLHAVALPMVVVPEGGIMLPPDPELEQSYIKELKEQVKQLQLENGFRFEAEAFCVSGGLQDCLAKMIQTHAVDLVVMGTKGASNFLDKLIGTNTADFIKVAPVPVLAIPGCARFDGIQRIAYASDFEHEKNEILAQLFTFAQPFKAEVGIVNIIAEGELDLLADGQVLEELAGLHPTQPFSVAQVKARNVIQGLKQYVTENQAQVLAVGIHQRDLLENLFHKSVSKQLAFETTLPLLTLPEKAYLAAVKQNSQKELALD